MKKFILPLVLLFLVKTSVSQMVEKERPLLQGWHLLDPQQHGYMGISLDKAYELLKGRKSTPVIVAVIDSGIDTAQEDLRPILWRNPKEVNGNGIDDDGNGYIDDVYGWNFCGASNGVNVERNSHEVPRVYHGWKSEFEGKKEKDIPKEKRFLFSQWKKAEKIINEEYDDANSQLERVGNFLEALEGSSNFLYAVLGVQEFTARNLNPKMLQEKEPLPQAYQLWIDLFLQGGDSTLTNKAIISDVREYKGQLDAKIARKMTPPEDWRSPLVKDKYTDITDKFYGNNNLTTGSGDHGSLVAGTIGAARNNGIGMDGIVDVRIMAIRAVPGGDEHDKDVALAIRYAVDNGAKIINMSFGKPVSPYKQFVDDAVKYAASKGVLLVHGAGNDGKDITTDVFYPNPEFIDGTRATNFLSVGASGDLSTGMYVASFSNYSKEYVDLFAPGMYIYSTAHNNSYKPADGTSLASPVATGVAALLKSYFPELTPEQIIKIMKDSGTEITEPVALPGDEEKKVKFSTLSSSGKVVNAYGAVKMALAL